MAMGIVSLPTRVRKLVAPNSPSEMAKAKPAPATSARRRNGRSTSRQTRGGEAPSVAAASRRRGSMERSVGSTARTTNGTATTAWAMGMRTHEPRRSSGAAVDGDEQAEADGDGRRPERQHQPGVEQRAAPAGGGDGDRRARRRGRRRRPWRARRSAARCATAVERVGDRTAGRARPGAAPRAAPRRQAVARRRRAKRAGDQAARGTTHDRHQTGDGGGDEGALPGRAGPGGRPAGRRPERDRLAGLDVAPPQHQAGHGDELQEGERGGAAQVEGLRRQALDLDLERRVAGPAEDADDAERGEREQEHDGRRGQRSPGAAAAA